MTTKRYKYLVFDVGCIECGEESGVVGVFADRAGADDAAVAARARQKDNWTGQHTIRVYDLGDASAYSQFRADA